MAAIIRPVRLARYATLLHLNPEPVLPVTHPLTHVLNLLPIDRLPDSKPAHPTDLQLHIRSAIRPDPHPALNLLMQPAVDPDDLPGPRMPRRRQRDAGVLPSLQAQIQVSARVHAYRL